MEVRIEKVFGASKYEQKVAQAPAAVTIVTADEISHYGHRTLADMVSRMLRQAGYRVLEAVGSRPRNVGRLMPSRLNYCSRTWSCPTG